MTDIVIVPAAPVVPPFPALGSPNFNQEAYDNGSAMPGVTLRVHELAVTAHTNATVASEKAAAAVDTAAQAVIDTNAIKAAAVSETTAIKEEAVTDTNAIKDQARGYRDDAAISALAAQGSANFKGEWSALSGALAMPATVRHAGKFWVLLSNLASVAAAEPGVSAAWAKTSAGVPLIAYDSRATLRATSGATGDQALVDGLGLFAYQDASAEPDDDESCFATASGRWLLQCPSWDVINDWQLSDDDERDSRATAIEARATAIEAATLRGAAACAVTSLAGVSSVNFAGSVPGAAVGDRVIATPPAELGATSADTGRLSYHAWVSAANTVTVTLTNASAAAANTNAAIRAAWPIIVFKGI